MNKKCTLSMLNQHFQQILDASRADGSEIGVFLFCNRAETDNELRLLVGEIAFVEPDSVLSRDEGHLLMKTGCYANAFCRAYSDKLSVVFLHSHPGGFPRYSPVDEAHDIKMAASAYQCAPDGPHGSAILVDGEKPHIIGRIWQSDGKFQPLTRVRVIGRERLFFFDRTGNGSEVETNTWAHRQILALGEEGHRLLSRLRVGVVGAGGTGSAICEQLLRLGVNFTVIDPDRLEITNVHRVLGSTISQAQGAQPKVEVVALHHREIGISSELRTIQGSINESSVAKSLLDCDIIFGCTDDNLGRAILSRMAVWYLIPVIDMGLAFPSSDGKLVQVIGRVTKVMPGLACLECTGAVEPGFLRAESLFSSDRPEYERLRALGYVRELGAPSPSVVPFTLSIAGKAAIEFLELVTGAMDRKAQYNQLNEIYNEAALVQLDVASKPNCWCADQTNWGAGDQEPFLGLTWIENTVLTSKE